MEEKPEIDNTPEISERPNLRDETWEYLIEIQKDIPCLIDDLVKIGDLILEKTLEWGETESPHSISPEMEALCHLKYFRDFLETMKEE